MVLSEFLNFWIQIRDCVTCLFPHPVKIPFHARSERVTLGFQAEVVDPAKSQKVLITGSQMGPWGYFLVLGEHVLDAAGLACQGLALGAMFRVYGSPFVELFDVLEAHVAEIFHEGRTLTPVPDYIGEHREHISSENLRVAYAYVRGQGGFPEPQELCSTRGRVRLEGSLRKKEEKNEKKARYRPSVSQIYRDSWSHSIISSSTEKKTRKST